MKHQVVGNNGYVQLGDFSTAIAGHHGTAVVGYESTAIVGIGGKVSAGLNSIIQIMYLDKGRPRIKVGYIGEEGLKEHTMYRLNTQNQFEKV